MLPFGLTSAPATFERLMERVLKGLKRKSLLLHLDHVIVFSPDFESLLERLAVVLESFKEAKLKLKPSKYELFQTQVKFLGHIVSRKGVTADPEKIKAVKEWTTPSCQTEVRTFLGFTGYYCRFCPDYASITNPLNQLTATGAIFKWGEEEKKAYERLRTFLINAPVRAYPDPKIKFNLDTDAS